MICWLSFAIKVAYINTWQNPPFIALHRSATTTCQAVIGFTQKLVQDEHNMQQLLGEHYR